MKQLSRADAELLSDLRQVDEKLGRLPEAMLEKDVFITEATLALSQLDTDAIGLVFCGGTSLSKAHRLVERMSEDVDFKLAVHDRGLSRNAQRALLREFRARAVEALKQLGYELQEKDVISRDANTYIGIKALYATRFTAHAAIRPDIRIAFNTAQPRLPLLTCTIRTLASDKLTLSRAGQLQCLDVSETMAEKLVSFTRRTAQFLANKHRGEFDTAIVRHLYDVHQLSTRGVVDLNAVSRLVNEIAESDARQFAHQHPEYAKDRVGETRKAIAALANDQRFEEWYGEFVEAMIYGDDKPRFREVADTFADAVHRAMKLQPR
ncbi:MAG: nucleotidyl transferase AbiEii/AbiGii toxin family protein [Betaproteobacteria bacterium]|nr:nucleotidyl transferase AbiEii/AbiGii toxin family protein [Betaproteobacteria bacterium]